LNRQVHRLGATENAIGIGDGAANKVCVVGAVGKQSAVSGKYGLLRNRWYMVTSCQHYDCRAMDQHGTIRHHDEAASGLMSKRGDDRFDFGVVMNRRYDRITLSDRAAASNGGR
jgi:hypothetical protein